MKKLEDIPKRNIFEVPEGYFERLPGMIQSRTAKSETKSLSGLSLSWGFALKYALPVFVIATVGLFWLRSADQTIEDRLAKIDTEQLAYFLEDSDLTTEDLAETVTWSVEDMEDLEESVYSTMEVSGNELDVLLNEFDIDNF